MAHPELFAPPVVAVLSGGNIDPLVLLHVTQHGLVAARRFLSLRIEIIDRPGSLAALLSLVGELGGNVVDVEHSQGGLVAAAGRRRGRAAAGDSRRRALRRDRAGADRVPGSGCSNSADHG